MIGNTKVTFQTRFRAHDTGSNRDTSKRVNYWDSSTGFYILWLSEYFNSHRKYAANPFWATMTEHTVGTSYWHVSNVWHVWENFSLITAECLLFFLLELHLFTLTKYLYSRLGNHVLNGWFHWLKAKILIWRDILLDQRKISLRDWAHREIPNP